MKVKSVFFRSIWCHWRFFGCLFVLSLAFSDLLSQLLHGRVISADSRQPLSHVNVQLKKAGDSSLVQTVETNNDGAYAITLHQTELCFLVFTHAGCTSIQTSPFLPTDKMDYGLTMMSHSNQELRSVTVMGKKPIFEQKTDRMVINTGASIGSSGSSVLDILSRAPGVQVNQQNNTISVAGKSGVVLMIDDKVIRVSSQGQVVQLLGGMNAANVERIEVITVPPVSLEAEGNAGYINIVLKKNTQYGTNGSYSLTLGYSRGWLQAASMNFNHRSRTFNVFGDLSLSHKTAEQYFTFYHKTVDKGQAIEVSTQVPRDWLESQINAKFGIDYQVSKKTIVGAMVIGFVHPLSITSNASGTYSVEHQVDTIMKLYNHEIHNNYNLDANLNLEHRINATDKFIFNLDYVPAWDMNPINYDYSFFDGNQQFIYRRQFRTDKETPVNTWTFRADYHQKLSERIRLETGIQGTWVKFDNSVVADSLSATGWVKENTFSARYRLLENYPMAYANFKVQAWKNTNLSLGVRYEYTNSNLGSDTLKNIVDRHYGNLFPLISINQTLGDQTSFSLSYNRRITRPKIWDLAPFVIFFDPYTYFSGNPFLLPAITDNYNFNFGWNNYSFQLTYSYEKNTITNFFPVVDSTTQIETFSSRNMDFTQTFSSVFTIPVRVNDWWNMSNVLSASWQRLKTTYNGSPLELSQTWCKIQSTQTFLLPRDYSFEVYGEYSTPSIMFFYHVAPLSTMNVYLRKKMKNAGVIALGAENILNTDIWRLSINEPSQNLVAQLNLRFSYPVFKVTFSHPIGHKKIEQSRDRETGSEDLMKRIK